MQRTAVQKSKCPKMTNSTFPSSSNCYTVYLLLFPHYIAPHNRPQIQISNPLAVLLVVGILRDKSTDAKGVDHGVGSIAEGKRCGATGLGVVLWLELLEALAVVQVIRERDIGRQVGAGVERAGALAAVERGREGVLVDPVGASGRARQAGGDAVAGGVDAVFGVKVNFRDDAGHVNALKVADAAGLVIWDEEVGEALRGDYVLADGTLISLGSVLEDVKAVIHVMVVDLMLVVIANSDRSSESGGSKEDSADERRSREMHFEL